MSGLISGGLEHGVFFSCCINVRYALLLSCEVGLIFAGERGSSMESLYFGPDLPLDRALTNENIEETAALTPKSSNCFCISS